MRMPRSVSSLIVVTCFSLDVLACGTTDPSASNGESRAGAGGESKTASGQAGGSGSGGQPLSAGGASSGFGGTTLTAGASNAAGAMTGNGTSGGASGQTGNGTSGGASGQAGNGTSGGASGQTGNGTSGGAGGLAGNGGTGGQGASLLVFSRTAAFRHASIPAGVGALTKLAADQGWRVAATEDASRFTDSGLAAYNVVVFLSTTGDVLNADQQAAFERFIRGGKGFVGIHAASDTEYDWPWYGELVGAYFREHPAVQAANVLVEDSTNPATTGLPNPWRRTDEWYAFRSNPRPNVHVLLSLDETSYTPGKATMNGDHPIAWCHEFDGGRAFYTALGHTNESFSDPLFIKQIAGAVSWVRAR
jgi:cytochrome c